MQELVSILVLLLALIVILVGYNVKSAPSPHPVVQATSQPIEPLPIYFPRPIYPFPRLNYPIRGFRPPMRPPIKY